MTYWCEKCGHNHKLDSKIGIEHLKLIPEEITVTGQAEYELITVTPELEEVSPDSNAGQGLDSLIEPSPAPAIETGDSLRGVEGERASGRELAQSWPEHVMKQIQILSDNDAIISQRLDQLQGTMYEATQSAESAQWNFDEFPEWLKQPAVKFLGDIGAAARALAGDQSASESEQVVRGAVKLMEEKAQDRIARRAAQIADAMEDPDTELYARKKPPVKQPGDVKKLE